MTAFGEGPKKVIFHFFEGGQFLLKKPTSLCSHKVTKTKRGPPGAENLVFTNIRKISKNSENFVFIARTLWDLSRSVFLNGI